MDFNEPPTSLFWRHSVEVPLPSCEGDRDLLLWAISDTLPQIFSLEPTVDVDGVLCWGSRGVADWQSGEKSEGVYWAWADGDPWTRRPPEARRDEKERTGPACPHILHGLLSALTVPVS